MHKLSGTESKGVIKVKGRCLIRPMKNQIWPCWGEGLTQERWCPPASHIREELNTGTLVAFPSALALKPHNSGPHNSAYPQLSDTSLAAFLPTGTQDEYLEVKESIHGPFKRTPELPTAFWLTLKKQNSGWFSHPNVIWAALLGIGIPNWVAQCGARALFRGDLCSWDSPSNSWPPQMGVRPAHFASLSLLPTLKGLYFISLVIRPLFI